jgi:hypothetical protein
VEENLNFHITENTFVDVNIEKLNDILRSSGHTQVDKDDDRDEINIKDCDEYDDDKIEKEDNSN